MTSRLACAVDPGRSAEGIDAFSVTRAGRSAGGVSAAMRSVATVFVEALGLDRLDRVSPCRSDPRRRAANK
jgi:hypothetical protein